EEILTILSNVRIPSRLEVPMEASLSAEGPRPLSALPSPRGLPFFGHVLDIWRDPLKLMNDSARVHGDMVRFRFGPYDFVLLNAPESVHHVLVERQKNYVKSASYDGLKLVLGNGLLTNEGEHWKKQRRLAQPAFHLQRLRGFADVMARATRDMLE